MPRISLFRITTDIEHEVKSLFVLRYLNTYTVARSEVRIKKFLTTKKVNIPVVISSSRCLSGNFHRDSLYICFRRHCWVNNISFSNSFFIHEITKEFQYFWRSLPFEKKSIQQASTVLCIE